MVYGRQFERWLKFIIAIALGFGLITACSRTSQTSSTSPTECRMIRHTRGETCVPLNPQRVVILFDPAIANALALGIKPVGIASSPAASGNATIHYLQDELAGVEFVGNQLQPSLEKILQLKPDLILGVVYQEYAQLSQIAPTVMFEWEGTSYWRQHFQDVAEVFGKTAAAEQLMARYARRIAELKTALGSRRTLKISCADYCCGGWRVDVKNSFIGSILNDAGLQRPAAQNVEVEGGLLELSEEHLSAMDGDILFISRLGDDEERTALNELERKPLWSRLKAVQRKQVHLVDMSIWRGSHILATDLVIDDLFKYIVQKQI